MTCRTVRATAASTDKHPYREWITGYAGESYQAVAVAARRHLDELAARALTGHRFAELATTFIAASRLEADFWQMGLDAAAGSDARSAAEPGLSPSPRW